jgi:hypothetical protein
MCHPPSQGVTVTVRVKSHASANRVPNVVLLPLGQSVTFTDCRGWNPMADSRRKSTMQPTTDPHGNARSGIPVPATIKKPSNNMRMSLAGPAIRAPYLTPSVPGTNPRQSMMRSQNLNPLLQSTSKPNYGRTPLNT